MARFGYSILFVADMQRSLAFYRDLMGLRVKSESPDWSEFETEGCTLALHLAAPGSTPLVPQLPGKFPAGHSHPGFVVDDIRAFADRMRDAGVPELKPIKREDFGAWFGVWPDPDGIPVSVMSFGE